MQLNEQKLKTFASIEKFLSQEMVNPAHFVAVVEKLVQIIQNSEKITVSALKKVKGITDTLDNSINDLSKEDKSIRADLRDQVNLLKRAIENVKTIKGDKGNDGQDAKPEQVAILLKNDPSFISLLKAKDGSPDMAEDIRNKLELLQGDERLDKSAIRGLDDLEKRIGENKGKANVIGGASGLRVYVDGVKKGLLKEVNLKAGSNVTLTHSIVNGLDTITFASSGAGGSSGSGAPNTTPASVPLFYVDTTNKNLYVSVGTSSSADWQIVASFA